MNFENAVSVITGAGSGIGRHLAIQLAERGSNLVITDINGESLSETEALLADKGVKIKAAILDVADREAFLALADEVEREMGPANAIFNNAGVAIESKVGATDRKHFEWIMNINFWGVVNGTEAFFPQINSSDNGCIVNVSSIFGMFSIPTQSAYNATKFAVRGYTESLAMEHRNSPISIHCVHPGGIRTNLVANATVGFAQHDREKAIKAFEKVTPTMPEEAAQIILNGVDKGVRRIIVGKDAKLFDRIVRWMPGTYEKVMAKLFKWK